MARIRTIKPEFWSSEQVMECSPLARLLFIGLWNFCDDGGNHPLSEKTIKALVFPGDDIGSEEIRRAIVELSSNGLLRLYECSGKVYLSVRGWKHQKIDRPTIKHPEFDDGVEVFPDDIWPVGHVVVDHSTSIRRVFDESSPPEGKGKGRDIDKDQKTCSSTSAEHVEFDQFWKLYPRKVGKQAALKAWNKLKPDMILFAEIERALEIAKSSPDWLKNAGQYIPHPSAWLNGRRWEDEQGPESALPFEEIVESYNEICGRVFKKCEALTPERMMLIRSVSVLKVRGRQRFMEGGIDFWSRFFSAAATSRTWAGDNPSGRIADIDCVLRNAMTVIEANQ